IVKAMGTLRMASDLGLLPRREFRVEIFEHLRCPGFEAGNLLADGGCTVAALERAQLRHPGLEFGHRLFEIEIAAHRPALRHAAPTKGSRGSCMPWRAYSSAISA